MARRDLFHVRPALLGSRSNQSGRLFLWGAACGFLVSTIFLMGMRYLVLTGHRPWDRTSWGVSGISKGSLVARGGLYAGILTRERTLQKAKATWNTWGMATTKMQVFSADSALHDVSLPLVTLQTDSTTLTDSSAMLGALDHVCNHVDTEQYDWFLFSRDDVYVHVINLKKQLVNLDPQAMYMVGQTGDAEEPEGSCSSRAGLVLSRTLVNRVCPHLGSCPAGQDFPRCVEQLTGVTCLENKQIHGSFQRLGVEEREQLASNKVDPAQGLSDLLGSRVTFVFPLSQPWLMNRLHEMYLRERIRTKGWTLTLTAVSAEELRSQVYLGVSSGSDDSSALCPEFTDYIHLQHHQQLYPGHSCFTTETASMADQQDIQQVFDAAIYHSIALDANYGNNPSTTSTVLDGYSCSSGTNTTNYVIHLASNQDKIGNIGNLTRTRIIHHLELPLVQTTQTRPMVNSVSVVLGVSINELKRLDRILKFWKELNTHHTICQLIIVPRETFKPKNISYIDVISATVTRHFPTPKGVLLLNQVSSKNIADALFAAKASIATTGPGAVIYTTPLMTLSYKYIRHCQTIASMGNGLYSISLQNHTLADINRDKTISLQEEESQELPSWVLHWSLDAQIVCMSSDLINDMDTIEQLEAKLKTFPRAVDPNIIKASIATKTR